MKHPIFIFGLTKTMSANIDGEVVEKRKVDRVKVEGYNQALFYAENSIPASITGSTIEISQVHIKEASEKHSDESVGAMLHAVESILRKKNKFLKLKKEVSISSTNLISEPENSEDKETEDQKKEFLIKSIIDLGGKADKRSSVETLEEKLLELQEGGDNGDTE